MWYAQEIATAFFSFISRYERREERLSLRECLEDWVELGDVVERAAGDFSLYQAVVIQILVSIEQTHSEYFERPLLRFGDGTTTCLERGFWDAAVFRRKYGTHPGTESKSY